MDFRTFKFFLCAAILSLVGAQVDLGHDLGVWTPSDKNPFLSNRQVSHKILTPGNDKYSPFLAGHQTGIFSSGQPPAAILTTVVASNRLNLTYEEFDRADHFAPRFFRGMKKPSSTSNYVISPFGAYLTLLMTELGASGDTSYRMGMALFRPRFPELIIPKVLNSFKELKNAHVKVSNSLLISPSVPFQNKFLDTASIFQTDFLPLSIEGEQGKVETTRNVNDWAAGKTASQIKDLIKREEIDDDPSRFYLLNVVYFKAAWAKPFSNGGEHKFYVHKWITKTIPMMFLSMKHVQFGDLTDQNAKFVAIPYKEPGLKMIIVVPNEKNYGYKRLESSSAYLSYDYFEQNSRNADVSLYLPKFQAETRADLAEVCRTLGMSQAFSNESEFQKMSDNKLELRNLFQASFVEVTEWGTHLLAPDSHSAEHSDENVPYAVRSAETLVADRPFLFMIYYEKILLLAGRISDPDSCPSRVEVTDPEEPKDM